MIFLFLSVHLIGAHYTYSLVPYNQWFDEALGVSPDALFGFERNHFDRLVHFLWGFLLFRPLYEVLTFSNMAPKKYASWFVISIIVTTSTLYELIEWLAALVFGGDLGVAYVGAQGDVWDAQKDQALALAGVLLAFLIWKCRAKRSLSSSSQASH
jgi:putative membrane protein